MAGPALPVSHCSHTEGWHFRGTAVPALSAQQSGTGNGNELGMSSFCCCFVLILCYQQGGNWTGSAVLLTCSSLLMEHSTEFGSSLSLHCQHSPVHFSWCSYQRLSSGRGFAQQMKDGWKDVGSLKKSWRTAVTARLQCRWLCLLIWNCSCSSHEGNSLLWPVLVSLVTVDHVPSPKELQWSWLTACPWMKAEKNLCFICRDTVTSSLFPFSYQ